MSEESRGVICKNCKTSLVLHYELLSEPSADVHPLGCPECQSVTDVVATWHRIENEAAPKYPHLTALKEKTEIGIAARMPPQSPLAKTHQINGDSE